MRSTRNLSLLKRLQRLEAARQKQADTAGRQAFIEIGDCDCDGARHLVMTGSDTGTYWFQEQPGPGPQLADFGEFACVLHLTPAEMEA
jgi:hypothetical protein